jgi:enoyl-CoA hydratase/carnithine racemase
VTVLTETRDHVAICTLNRPERLNAIDLETYDGIMAFAAAVQADDAVWIGIITGAGERAFSAGADLKKLPGQMAERGRDTAPPWPVGFARQGLAKPLIAAVNGLAYGGGMELALACDLRVMAPGAVMALPEPKRGLIPGWGGTQLLPRLLPRAVALELLYTGRDITADEALGRGLCNRVADDALDGALALAEEICANAPTSVRSVREAVERGAQLPLADGIAIEDELMQRTWTTADSAEGIAAFIEKRPPIWPGR